ncbi:hypothetical protein BC629DRAFT_1601655 [Irpex lacteus]|nr:hypothetical protein BC629DRAFT_1601655 [Irpex lacteus]
MKNPNALLAIASTLENARGMDDFFKATAKEGTNFPLDPRLEFSLRFATRTKVDTQHLAQFKLRCPAPDDEDEYTVWIHNYDVATARACQKALAFALRELATKDFFMSRPNAINFM